MSDEDKVPYKELAELDKLRRVAQLEELMDKGYFTMEDGSKSTDAKNIKYSRSKGKHDSEIKPKNISSAYAFYVKIKTKAIMEET